jgi:hypothetical protein
MMRRMPAPLIAEWAAFDALEPFGEERADLRVSALLQTMVNLQRNQKRHPRPFTLDDFILRFGDAAPAAPRRTQTPQQQFDILKAIALAYAKQRAARAQQGGGPPPRSRRKAHT